MTTSKNIESLGLNSDITDFLRSATFTAKAIIGNKTPDPSLYRIAALFIYDCDAIMFNAQFQGKVGDEEYWFEDEISELENKFLTDLAIVFATLEAEEKLDNSLKDLRNPLHYYWEDCYSESFKVNFIMILN